MGLFSNTFGCLLDAFIVGILKAEHTIRISVIGRQKNGRVISEVLYVDVSGTLSFLSSCKIM